MKLGRGPQRNGHETTITTKTTHIGAYTTRHNETPVVPAHSSRLHGLAPLRQKCFQTPTHFTIFPIVREVYGRCSEVCLPSTSRPSIPRSVLPTLRATKPPFRPRLLRTRSDHRPISSIPYWKPAQSRPHSFNPRRGMLPGGRRRNGLTTKASSRQVKPKRRPVAKHTLHLAPPTSPRVYGRACDYSHAWHQYPPPLPSAQPQFSCRPMYS